MAEIIFVLLVAVNSTPVEIGRFADASSCLTKRSELKLRNPQIEWVECVARYADIKPGWIK